ncbi:hypothetical protein GF312_04555 [Candidatus Poribacteria bacterium]|nr:hypothetical protein [Candidatus Poribacteria bacterium]
MLIGVYLMILPSVFSAAEDQPADIIDEWLQKPVLNPGEFRTEIQKYIRSFIPELEMPETAEEWEEESQEMREEILDEIVFGGVPSEWYEGKPDVVWGDVIETDKGYVIRKLRYEALPGLWIPALLYEPSEIGESVPGILNVNGHVGPPGKTIDYEQIRCINLAKRGMLALHPEWLFFGELSGDDYKHNRLSYLDLCGVRGLSVFFLAIQRGIDVLEDHANSDPERIAMTGLSGGGWQTIILSSLDTRISATTPNAGYIGLDYRTQFREDVGDLEQNPSDLLTIADYTHLTAMLAPRHALLIYNEKDDCCFQSYRSEISVYKPIIPFYQLFDAEDRFHYHTNYDPGTHNYDKDNRERFYKFINRCFLTESEWIDEEIPSDDEVLEYDDLVVGIPDDNANFFTLAKQFLDDLPGEEDPPEDEDELEEWKYEAFERLVDILNIVPMETELLIIAEASSQGKTAKWYKMSVNDDWTVPVVMIKPSKDSDGPVAILFGDKGKASLAETAKKLLAEGKTVVAVDPLFIGESVSDKCPPSQCAMMVSAVGERPLGIQVAQLVILAEWICRANGVDSVSIHSNGWNSGIASICACALNNESIKAVYAIDCPESLKNLILDHVDYEQYPPLFCFGLLEQFDIPELKKLCEPSEIRIK